MDATVTRGKRKLESKEGSVVNECNTKRAKTPANPKPQQQQQTHFLHLLPIGSSPANRLAGGEARGGTTRFTFRGQNITSSSTLSDIEYLWPSQVRGNSLISTTMTEKPTNTDVIIHHGKEDQPHLPPVSVCVANTVLVREEEWTYSAPDIRLLSVADIVSRHVKSTQPATSYVDNVPFVVTLQNGTKKIWEVKVHTGTGAGTEQVVSKTTSSAFTRYHHQEQQQQQNTPFDQNQKNKYKNNHMTVQRILVSPLPSVEEETKKAQVFQIALQNLPDEARAGLNCMTSQFSAGEWLPSDAQQAQQIIQQVCSGINSGQMPQWRLLALQFKTIGDCISQRKMQNVTWGADSIAVTGTKRFSLTFYCNHFRDFL